MVQVQRILKNITAQQKRIKYNFYKLSSNTIVLQTRSKYIHNLQVLQLLKLEFTPKKSSYTTSLLLLTPNWTPPVRPVTLTGQTGLHGSTLDYRSDRSIRLVRPVPTKQRGCTLSPQVCNPPTLVSRGLAPPPLTPLHPGRWTWYSRGKSRRLGVLKYIFGWQQTLSN